MRWRSIHYGLPEAALLIFIVLLLFAAFIMLYRYRQKCLSSLADPRILTYIQEPRQPIYFWIKSLFFCAAWIFGVLALMEPKGNGRYPQSPYEQADNSKPQTLRQVAQDVIFLIDASASMFAEDTPTKKSRLDESKEIAEEIISRLRGQNVTLFAFTSSTMQLVPLTTDYLFSRLILRQLSINEGETAGTDILQALTRMRDLVLNSAVGKQISLVMLTDGGDTYLESLQGAEREEYAQKIASILHNAGTGQFSVYIVGLGSKQGKEIPGVTYQGHPIVSAINEQLLQQIAQSAQGELFLNYEMGTLPIADAILADLKSNQQFQEKQVLSPRIESRPEELIYDLYFQIPLGIGIILLTLALLLPEVRLVFSLIVAVMGTFCVEMYAQDLDVQQQKALLFFDAGDFSRAVNQYKSMLDEPLLPWQHAIASYNLGTAKLNLFISNLNREQEKWNEVLQIFQVTKLAESPLPLLNYRLHLNIALAQLLMANDKFETAKQNRNATLKDYITIMQLLQEVDNEARTTEDVRCQLMHMEGATTCEASIKINEIQLELRRQYAQVLQAIHDLILSDVTLQTGAGALLAGSKAALENMDFLIENSMEDHLKSEYAQLFYRQANSWLPLWEGLDHRFQKNSEKEKHAIFQKAMKSFNNGTDLMHNHKYADSAQAYKESVAGLNDVVQLEFADKTIEEIVQSILAQYDISLMNEPLQHLALESLMELQTLIPSNKLEDKHLNDMFQNSQHALDAALHALKNNQMIQAKIYSNEARFQMSLISQQLDKTAKHSPKTLLQQIIDVQEHALSLNRLRTRMEETESPDPHVNDLIKRAQSQVLRFPQIFYQAVMDTQKKGMHTADSKGTSANNNAHIIWADVLTLFAEGLKSAQQGEKLLTVPNGDQRNSAISLQNKAVASWKDALAAMQKKKKSDIKQKEEQQSMENQSEEKNQSPSQQPQPEKIPEQRSGSSSLNDILRSLQEMENDDRSQPHFKTPGEKEVERPW
jgi:Ca-activated chloride channel family protein